MNTVPRIEVRKRNVSRETRTDLTQTRDGLGDINKSLQDGQCEVPDVGVEISAKESMIPEEEDLTGPFVKKDSETEDYIDEVDSAPTEDDHCTDSPSYTTLYLVSDLRGPRRWWSNPSNGEVSKTWVETLGPNEWVIVHRK